MRVDESDGDDGLWGLVGASKSVDSNLAWERTQDGAITRSGSFPLAVKVKLL